MELYVEKGQGLEQTQHLKEKKHREHQHFPLKSLVYVLHFVLGEGAIISITQDAAVLYLPFEIEKEVFSM
jgi:hypothetical protein